MTMAIVRWNPVRDLPPFPGDILGIQREINQMFDSFLRGETGESAQAHSSWKPAVDIVEHDDAYIAKVELPGVRKEDVKITMQDDVLTIRGEKHQEKKENKNANFHRIERFYGSFQRSFTLPTSVRNENIDAEFSNGILTVRMPKAEEAKPKEIEVKLK